MKYLIKRLFLIFWVVLFLFSLAVPSAQAWDFRGISAGDISDIAETALKRIEKEYGLNRAEARYMVQTANVSRQKKNPPLVQLTFNPPDPVEGEKVTATATHSYFTNDTKDLYFTWFLKTAKCGRGASATASCDEDGSGNVTIEDWKIKAARIIANDDFNWEAADYAGSNDNDGYKAITGGDDQGGKNGRCYVHDTRTGNEYQLKQCGHLFPNAPGEKSGDGSFGRNEERFWHTDPGSDDTAHTGNNDEANVVGLGQNTFTWTFSEGDKVGVVVEGISVEPTQYYDSSMRTMFAMPVSMCDVDSGGGVNTGYPQNSNRVVSVTSVGPREASENQDAMPAQTTTVTENTKQEVGSIAGGIAGIVTTVTTTTTVTNTDTGAVASQSSTSTSEETVRDITSSVSLSKIKSVSDLNACLYNNLISPAENGPQSEKLSMDLSYSPLSPINDPTVYADSSLSAGDTLTIQSSNITARDKNYLQYTWEVFESDEANPNSWGEAILKSKLPESTPMIGLGLESFKFKLNLANPRRYLKVKLTAKENVGQNLFREGHNYVVIPINSTNKRIRAYTTTASDAPSPIISMNAKEMCTNELEKAVCPAAKNQIIGVKVDETGLTDFLWTIDDKPIIYPSCFFAGCNPNKQTNVAYFPMLKAKGERYIINLIATDISSGAKINLTKVFEVTDPTIKIISTSESTCGPNLLGHYIDLDGKVWPDYSKENFWALKENPISLATETKGFDVSPDRVTWYIDGKTINTLNAGDLGISFNNESIVLPAKYPMESYSVTVNSLYYQNEEARRALHLYWDVSYDQLYEKVVTDNINVTMRNTGADVAQSDSQQIFASLYLSTPAYLAFLVRIVLTAFLIIFTSKLVFLFFPKTEEN